MEPAFELILLSPEKRAPNEGALLSYLFKIGLASYHLRKPDLSLHEMRGYLLSVPEKFHNRIVLHSNFELAEEFGVKGVHLNEENRKLYPQFKGQKIISTSFHSVEEIRSNIHPYEYIFLSPIFDSISKAGYKGKFDLKSLCAELDKVKAQKLLPKIIALGGIDAENIELVRQSGFEGAALLGYVWESGSPVQRFLEIQAIIKSGG